MNLLMTATPLAMDFCGLAYAQAAMVISWHVVGMYGPGFVTGSLINRFGVTGVILGGVVVMAAGAAVALAGNAYLHFLIALVLVGVGWNFMYTGGTTLLTETYTPAEKARTQGFNDALMFTSIAVASFSSGALVSGPGWATMNYAVLSLLVPVVAAVVWYLRTPGGARARASG
jgi:MFS family permease